MIDIERARKPKTLLTLLALSFAVAAIWAATALANGGSSSTSSDPSTSQPAVDVVQSQADPVPAADDCPEHQGGSSGGSGGSSGSDGTSSSDF